MVLLRLFSILLFVVIQRNYGLVSGWIPRTTIGTTTGVVKLQPLRPMTSIQPSSSSLSLYLLHPEITSSTKAVTAPFISSGSILSDQNELLLLLSLSSPLSPSSYSSSPVLTATSEPKSSIGAAGEGRGTASSVSLMSSSLLQSSISIATTVTPEQLQQQQQPTKQDVLLLQNAFDEFFTNNNYERSVQLFTNVIQIWTTKRLPMDEISGLYRVRADCYMKIGNALLAKNDYNSAIEYLEKKEQGQQQENDNRINIDIDDEDDDEIQKQRKDELAIALLGRARATKSLVSSSLSSSLSSTTITKQQQQQQQEQKGKDNVKNNDDNYNMVSLQGLVQNSMDDYERYLILSSREEWDTTNEYITDGILRNPYAGWEYGTIVQWYGTTMTTINTNNNNKMKTKNPYYEQAAKIHILTSSSFYEIGDKARSVLSALDAGIDYAMAAAVSTDVSSPGSSSSSSSTSASTGSTRQTTKRLMKIDPILAKQAEEILRKSIRDTIGLNSRRTDIELLRHVIIKEGEGRMALAAILWNNGSEDAETYLGDACIRLDQLQAQIDEETNGQIQKQQQQQLQKQQTQQSKTTLLSKATTTTTSTITAAKNSQVLYTPVLYSIDDERITMMENSGSNGVGGSGSSILSVPTCSRYRNRSFLTEKLKWPASLQELVIQLETLEK